MTHTELLQLLRDIEWKGGACPECDGLQPERSTEEDRRFGITGHRVDCRLLLAIQEPEDGHA